jgi:hypothetical protein
VRPAGDLGHEAVVLAVDRLLDEHRLVRLQRLDEELGGRRADRPVEVDGDVRIVARGLAQLGEPLRGVADLGRRLDVAGVPPLRRSGLERPEALFQPFLDPLGRAGVGVHANPPPRRPAEQLVHRHAERLALEVPQRHVDPA